MQRMDGRIICWHWADIIARLFTDHSPLNHSVNKHADNTATLGPNGRTSYVLSSMTF